MLEKFALKINSLINKKINLPHKLQRNAFMRLFPFFNKRVLGDLSNAKEFNIIQ